MKKKREIISQLIWFKWECLSQPIWFKWECPMNILKWKYKIESIVKKYWVTEQEQKSSNKHIIIMNEMNINLFIMPNEYCSNDPFRHRQVWNNRVITVLYICMLICFCQFNNHSRATKASKHYYRTLWFEWIDSVSSFCLWFRNSGFENPDETVVHKSTETRNPDKFFCLLWGENVHRCNDIMPWRYCHQLKLCCCWRSLPRPWSASTETSHP